MQQQTGRKEMGRQETGQQEAGFRPEDDFNFMFGKWRVTHRRLRERLSGCSDWDTFEGTSETFPVLGGTGNLEDNLLHLPGGAYRAVALRSFDPATKLWSIWWLDGRAPHRLDTPVTGRFEDDTGEFYVDDTSDDRPIRVRFRWIRGDRPRWEQAFSTDNGESWETNWTMTFTRLAG